MAAHRLASRTRTMVATWAGTWARGGARVEGRVGEYLSQAEAGGRGSLRHHHKRRMPRPFYF